MLFSRIVRPAAAVVAVLTMAACGAHEAGTAVVGDAATAMTGSGATAGTPSGEIGGPPRPGEPTPSGDPTQPSNPTQPNDPSPDAPTETSGSADPPSTAEPDGTGSTPAPSETTNSGETDDTGASGVTDTSGDTVPQDLCQLMPADLSDGLEKDDGDTERACLYSAMVDHQYISVHVFVDSRPVDPDDPNGSSLAEVADTPTIDGRQAYTWFTRPQEAATVAFDAGEGALFMSYLNEGKSNDENMQVSLALAERISKGVRNGGTIEGVATPPPSTTANEIPEGERGWPGVVCDLLPAELVQEMTTAKGNEAERCRLEAETATGFTNINVRKAYALDPEDPTGGLSTDVQQETFDGRTAYSWLGGDQVPRATVVFDTGDKSSAVIEYSIADVEKPVDPEDVRKAAIELAEKIAPKLPQP